MVYFVGAGPGAADLITVRGMRLLEKADVVIYAGSLVNPELLSYCKKECEIHNSAYMTLEEVLNVMEEAEKQKLTTVRLHTGEPSIYGAVREQMDLLDEKGKRHSPDFKPDWNETLLHSQNYIGWSGQIGRAHV